ncbi:hypothetical protein IEQ34_015122 [Dendrobium chrysotoxum]|uniref:Uncharacterized protein n=1 Tax=Dendrobium chrysotoxum TaxID=161865 RepID=A0AAV7G5S1_DENCH|nr:hypothetical protein IEQ34_015122 [Dendrobium chrysotoxum]
MAHKLRKCGNGIKTFFTDKNTTNNWAIVMDLIWALALASSWALIRLFGLDIIITNFSYIVCCPPGSCDQILGYMLLLLAYLALAIDIVNKILPILFFSQLDFNSRKVVSLVVQGRAAHQALFVAYQASGRCRNTDIHGNHLFQVSSHQYFNISIASKYMQEKRQRPSLPLKNDRRSSEEEKRRRDRSYQTQPTTLSSRGLHCFLARCRHVGPSVWKNQPDLNPLPPIEPKLRPASPHEKPPSSNLHSSSPSRSPNSRRPIRPLSGADSTPDRHQVPPPCPRLILHLATNTCSDFSFLPPQARGTRKPSEPHSCPSRTSFGSIPFLLNRKLQHLIGNDKGRSATVKVTYSHSHASSANSRKSTKREEDITCEIDSALNPA